MDAKPVVEKEFEYQGHPCVVMFQPLGFRTGYVGISEGENGFGICYEEFDVYCHGGLTYGCDHLPCMDPDGRWWVGFDCGHFGDGYDIDKMEEYWPDAESVKQDAEWLKYSHRLGNPAKTVEFVEEELKTIVDQLNEKEK